MVTLDILVTFIVGVLLGAWIVCFCYYRECSILMGEVDRLIDELDYIKRKLDKVEGIINGRKKV